MRREASARVMCNRAARAGEGLPPNSSAVADAASWLMSSCSRVGRRRRLVSNRVSSSSASAVDNGSSPSWSIPSNAASSTSKAAVASAYAIEPTFEHYRSPPTPIAPQPNSPQNRRSYPQNAIHPQPANGGAYRRLSAPIGAYRRLSKLGNHFRERLRVVLLHREIRQPVAVAVAPLRVRDLPRRASEHSGKRKQLLVGRI